VHRQCGCKNAARNPIRRNGLYPKQAESTTISKRIHLLTEAQALAHLNGQQLNCREHDHLSLDQATNQLRWRVIRAISDTICVKRAFIKSLSPDRMREFVGWKVCNRWTEPVTQLLTPETR